MILMIFFSLSRLSKEGCVVDQLPRKKPNQCKIRSYQDTSVVKKVELKIVRRNQLENRPENACEV